MTDEPPMSTGDFLCLLAAVILPWVLILTALYLHFC